MSLQSRCLCCHCDNVVARAVMALLPLSSWCCRPHHNGITAIVNSQVSLLLSRWCCCPLALEPLPTLHGRCGIVVSIAQASLPSHQMGIITIDAPALLPLSSWYVCTIALVSLPLSCWDSCPWCTGISALVTQASLPLLCLHCAVDLQASLPSLSWPVLSRG